jgi:hypothetical protein
MLAFDILTNPNRRYRKETIIGGVFTILTIVITSLLLINEFSNFKGLKIIKNIYLDPHPLDEKINIRLKIKLRNTPCAILSLDLLDDLKHHQVDIPIKKTKIKNQEILEEYIKEEDNEKRYEQIKDDLDKGVGCLLDGNFDVDKVSGNFHISFHNYMDHYRKLVRIDHDKFMKLNLSYEIEELLFGSKRNEDNKERIESLLKEMKLDSQLLNNYIDHKEILYDHFIGAHWLEIIPYKFLDNRDNFEFSSYLHSFNRKIKEIETEEIDNLVPNLEFHYKFSTLSAKYEIEVKKKFHFIIELIAVVGALYAFFSIFTASFDKIVEFFKKED